MSSFYSSSRPYNADKNTILQANMPLPKYPVLFYKPITSLGGPSSPIPVAAMAQEAPGLDYECELVVVIGKPATDVPVSSALDYVLGYAVGNDVSHREWQLQRGGGESCSIHSNNILITIVSLLELVVFVLRTVELHKRTPCS